MFFLLDCCWCFFQICWCAFLFCLIAAGASFKYVDVLFLFGMLFSCSLLVLMLVLLTDFLDFQSLAAYQTLNAKGIRVLSTELHWMEIWIYYLEMFWQKSACTWVFEILSFIGGRTGRKTTKSGSTYLEVDFRVDRSLMRSSCFQLQLQEHDFVMRNHDVEPQ